MKYMTLPLVALAYFIFLLSSCNPDCESISGLQLSSDFNPSNYQVLISAAPPSSLIGRRIYFNDQEVNTVYQEGAGLIVTVPEGLPENSKIRIEDPDCIDFFSLDFRVVGDNFFLENAADYVFPPLPEIIIPTIEVVSFPPNIENAWLSPNNLDYCMWFKFEKDDNGNCTAILDPAESREQCFGDCLEGIDVKYNGNPIFGVIDAENNIIDITIDRTDNGGDYERFTGIFINPENTGDYQIWEAGNEPIGIDGVPVNTSRDHMILLKSESSGRYLLIYQQDLNPELVSVATKECE